MNLYDLHSNPRELYKHVDAMTKMPGVVYEVLWSQYKNLSLAQRNEMERVIAKSAKYSYLYANRVKNERFPAGEAAIAKDPWYALRYARYLSQNLEEEFPEGEAAIAKDPWCAVDYAISVIYGRFHEGEAAIASQPDTAYRYAVDIIDGRWPMGEAAIRKDAAIYQEYKEFLRSIG